MYDLILLACRSTLSHILVIKVFGWELLRLIRAMSSMAVSRMSKRSSIAYTRLRRLVLCSMLRMELISRGRYVCNIQVYSEKGLRGEKYRTLKNCRGVLFISGWWFATTTVVIIQHIHYTPTPHHHPTGLNTGRSSSPFSVQASGGRHRLYGLHYPKQGFGLSSVLNLSGPRASDGTHRSPRSPVVLD